MEGRLNIPAVLLLHDALVLIESVVGAADERRCVRTLFVAERGRSAVRGCHGDHVLSARELAQFTFRPVNKNIVCLLRE